MQLECRLWHAELKLISLLVWDLNHFQIIVITDWSSYYLKWLESSKIFNNLNLKYYYNLIVVIYLIIL